jgi:hypothetical protein
MARKIQRRRLSSDWGIVLERLTTNYLYLSEEVKELVRETY